MCKEQKCACDNSIYENAKNSATWVDQKISTSRHFRCERIGTELITGSTMPNKRHCVQINIDTVCNLIEVWVSSMRHANASPSYNAGTSRMRMRGLSKSTNRTSRLIYGFCKPCTVIGLSRGWSEAKRTKCEIIQKRQIEFRRAYISDRLDLKISSAAIIISTRRRGRHARSSFECFKIIFSQWTEGLQH